MKILIVHNGYQQPGGEDIVVAQESRLLEENGHQVYVYLRSNEELNELSFIGRMGLFSRIVSASDSRAAVRKILRDFKPDVVHVHNTFAMVSPSVYDACHEEDVPVVQTLHNYRLLCPAATFYRNGDNCQECVTDGLRSSIRHACYRDSRVMTGAIALMLKVHRARQTWNEHIAAYVALSRFAKNRFVQCGLPAHNIYIKPNFVEPDPGARERSPAEFALFVGRLSQEKGVLTLLHAWQNLQSKIPLVVAGDGPMRPVVEAEVVTNKLRSIRLAGQLKREEIYQLLKKAAFLIVPSLWEEPFGLIVAEAYACGTPVIAASSGALQDMVEDQVTGLKYPPKDSAALARKVEWAWNHRAQMEDMGKAARRVYEQRYTGNVNYWLLMEIYAAAIDSHFRFKRKRPLSAAA